MHAEPQQIVIALRRGGWGSRVEDGRFFYRYSVSEHGGREIGWGRVRGTSADVQAWRAAEAAFTEAVLSAGRAYERVVDSWWRGMPGHARRVERAERAYRRATEAAEAAYRPVVEEILRREQAAVAERRQQDAERWRRQEKAQADAAERSRRERALAERPIWGWSAVDPTTVRVVESAEQGLTAAELEEALCALHGSGVRTVEWDPAARDTVARTCAPPGRHPTDSDFRSWWMSATRHVWRDPGEIPPPRPPGRDGSRNHATFHHSDYGGDYGGGHGATHGTSF